VGAGLSQISKWHHYVPQGVLSKFCYSGSKFYYFSKDRSAEGVASRDIEKKFRKRHYYSFTTVNGQKSDALERNFLQILDSRFVEFTTAFANSISAGKARKVDHDTREFLQKFFYYHSIRNPDFSAHFDIYQDPKSEIKAAIEIYEQSFGCLDPTRVTELLEPKKIEELVRFARVHSLANPSPMINELLSKMNLHFAIAPAGKQFLIGSNPVVRFANKKGSLLGDGNVELWTAITPSIAMGFAGPNKNHVEILNIDHKEVRKFNLELFRQSTEVAGASKALVTSVIGNR
jgi:hypothetical protein